MLSEPDLAQDADESIKDKDPCAEVRRLSQTKRSRKAALKLAAQIQKSHASCGSVVPTPFRVEIALAVCEGALDFSLPGSWALAAIEDTAGLGSEVIACLVGHAAEVEQGLAASLAQYFATAARRAKFSRLPRAAPDKDLLDLVLALVRVRSPLDTTWWEAFWKGLTTDQSPLRVHLYIALGQVHGPDALWDFLGNSVEWEDSGTDVGMYALSAASNALRRFRNDQKPSMARLLPPSPKMRIVAMHSLPIGTIWPTNGVPWYSTEDAQERLRGLLDSEDKGPAEASWRASYLVNEWAWSGHDAALRAYDRALGASAPPLTALSDETRMRITSALVAYSLAADSNVPRVAAYADPIGRALRETIGRASPKALQSLVFALDSLMGVARYRTHLGALLQSRLDELPEKLRARLTR